MKKILTSLIVLFCIQVSYSQNFRKYANNYLYQGVDARGRALGNAVVSSSDDVFSSYWNPAGLAAMDRTRTQIGYMHVFDGLYNYDVAGVAFPTNNEKQAIGITAVRYGVDDIPNTLEGFIDSSGNINFDNVKGFSSADYGAFLTYSRKIKEGLTVGGSAKVLHRSVGDFAKAWGAGIDLGIRYVSENERLIAAATARDAVGTYASWNFNFTDPSIRQVFEETNNEIPKDGTIEAATPNLVLGLSYLFELGDFTIQPEGNLDLTFDGKRNTILSSDFASADPHAGVEFGYDKTIFLRAGVNNVQKITNTDTFAKKYDLQPSAGAGVKLEGIEVDYALTQFDFRNELTHLVTLKIGLARNVRR